MRGLVIAIRRACDILARATPTFDRTEAAGRLLPNPFGRYILNEPEPEQTS